MLELHMYTQRMSSEHMRCECTILFVLSMLAHACCVLVI